MLTADSVAAICSLLVLLLSRQEQLMLWHIYLTNCITGFMNAFQAPASSVAIGKIVPQDKIKQVSGLDSFSSNLVMVFSPMLAAALFAAGGLTLVIAIDLISFCFAFLVLLFVLRIPEELSAAKGENRQKGGLKEGLDYLRRTPVIYINIITMALINFLSRLTYENILSPMILSRSGNDTAVLGIVNAAIGIGGIAGGILVSSGKIKWDSLKMIYFSAAFSFCFGDLLMGMGRNVYLWSLAAIAASFPIAFIDVGHMDILYRTLPSDIQGRVFAVRNALQKSTIPLGILLGGALADYVFEPFMAGESSLAAVLSLLVGTGSGSGMAVMFLCTGILGSTCSILSYRKIRACSH